MVMDSPNNKYHDLLRRILLNGENRDPSRGQSEGTREIFGREMQMDFDLRNGLPIISTKEIYIHGIIVELLWFLKGDTNIKYLVDNNVNIWNKNAFEFFQRKFPDSPIGYKDFMMLTEQGKSRTDDYTYGDLGPIYGEQFRKQLGGVIEKILKKPDSRSILLDVWNAEQISEMAIPPCHTVPLHFRVYGEYLDAHMYQRSADMFLGVPFNITSTSLLVLIIAKLTGKTPRYFSHTLGSAHIYKSHLKLVEQQIKRDAKIYPSQFDYELPTLDFYEDLLTITPEDIRILNYQAYPLIRGSMVV
jgi:thymidylate synthase